MSTRRSEDASGHAFAPPPAVRVATSPGKGRGVFATRAIAAGETIERAPVLPLPKAAEAHVLATPLDAYVFEWRGAIAICWGYGSLYNHSWSPNVEYRKRLDEDLIEFVALRDIAPGDELCTNYTTSNPHRADLWAHLVD